MPVIDVMGRVKYEVKGGKRYRPVMRFGRTTRMLRRYFRTATAAKLYSARVMIRYRRWCDVALAMIMTEAQR